MSSFKDFEFEKVADFLEEQSRTFPQSQREIALRRAINTIYYGVFWEVRDRLRKRGYKIRERQPHYSAILKTLLTEFPEIYPLMEELKKWRELADYQSNWKPDLKKFYHVKYLAQLILEEENWEMQNTIINVLEEIRQEVETLLKKHNIRWTNIEVWETSDGFLVEILSPDFKDHIPAIKTSKQLEEELKDPSVSISILPAG